LRLRTSPTLHEGNGAALATVLVGDILVPSKDGSEITGREFRLSRTTALTRVSEFAVQNLTNGTLRRETVDVAGFVTAREINRAGRRRRRLRTIRHGRRHDASSGPD
jgi:hypothetical protein